MTSCSMRSVLVLAVTSSLTLAGCSGGDSDGGPDQPAQATSKTSAPPVGDPQENGAAAAGIDQTKVPEPLGAVTIPLSGGEVESSRAELLELKVKGKLLLGTFRVTPQGGSATEPVDAVDALGEFWTPELRDLEGLKRYTAFTELRSNQWGVKAAPGKPMYLWAAWPVPQGARTVDVQVSTLAPTIEDVPLP